MSLRPVVSRFTVGLTAPEATTLTRSLVLAVALPASAACRHAPPAAVTAFEPIVYRGNDLSRFTQADFEEVFGRVIALIDRYGQ